MPIAEAEEGVPFVSESERELEAAEAAGHAAPQWDEPARPEAGTEPERAVETGPGGPESTAGAEPRPLAEPERTETPPEAPASRQSRKCAKQPMRTLRSSPPGRRRPTPHPLRPNPTQHRTCPGGT